MQERYTIWVLSSPDFIWSRVFDEVAVGLQSAFRTLGYDVPVVRDAADIKGTALVLGPHLAPYLKITLPENLILFNLEQVHPGWGWFKPDYGYIELLKKYPVWDFSLRNIAALKKLGIESAVHCGIGYAEELTRIPAAEEDTDVLLVGTRQPRRDAVLDALRRQGAKVHQLAEAFGEERDQWLARSKVHLNIHQAQENLFEIVRVSYLLANKRFVISESGPDKDAERRFRGGVVFCRHEEMAERALYYLEHPEERARIAERGFEIIRSMPQSGFLAAALEKHHQLHEAKKACAAAQPRLFVAIASYRDPECQWTVKDLFEKAAHPERIHVGVCWQYDPEADTAYFSVDPPRPEQVRVIQFHCRDSKGANWARAQAMQLRQGEEYVLVIDSHMRFEPGWDKTLLDALKRCDSDKPIVTAWLPGYKPPAALEPDKGEIERLRVSSWGFAGDAQLINLNRFYVPAKKVKGRMEPACSCVANFIFAPADAFAEAPFDPHIDFWGDEINQAARLWTHGWDFFQLDRRALYHYWDPENIKDRDQYRDRQNPRHQKARKRNLHLFGMEKTDDGEALAELEKYPLGSERRLEDYWRFAGVDFATKTIAPHAMSGKWVIPRPSIFVAIASYRDPECRHTLKDLFEKAAYPGRIHVGVCLQADPEEDQNCLVDAALRPGQIMITQCHYKESQGANWARAKALELRRNEEYVLQIDSHMRFEPGWDKTLIDMLKRCPAQKPVVSGYLPNYDPPDKRSASPGHLLRMRVRRFGNERDPQLIHITGTFVEEKSERGGLYPSPFYVANFMFARAALLKEVPIDPGIHFYGDEISYAARLWTHGWDIFQPDRVVLFHYWVRKETMPLQHYRNTASERSQQSRMRVRHLLGFEEAKDKKTIEGLEHYGLGHTRPLEALWAFAGIDWQEREVSKGALEGVWNLEARNPKPENKKIHLSNGHGLKDSIFVNIASYRDKECQWTVKDLFEKAAHPDRIRIGICWQFDPEKDKDCFTVSTRPKQVSMLPVDWREAEGVCWARHQAQQLWNGERYALQIDAHMRFVPGWDELMIEELKACESAKPVLSCTMGAYTPPYQLQNGVVSVVRRVQPFLPDGNLRGKNELIDRVPEKPLNGAFIAAGFVFSEADIITEVPYDPYLYFDQEEISYAARAYTHGWDVFSARRPLMYHYYNDNKAKSGSVRPLHWSDLNKENEKKIRYLRERGLKRFNHLTGFRASDDPDILKDLESYGFGRARTLAQFEEYTGIDFKKKTVSEKGLRCLFVRDLEKYRDKPIHVPELDDRKKANGHAAPAVPPRRHGMEEGDFVPLFETVSAAKHGFAIETMGGRHTALFFLPANDRNYVREFFRQMQPLNRQKEQHIGQVFIFDTGPDELMELKKAENIPQQLLVDPERKLAQTFGLWRPGDNR
ncbi:MAG: hypothetical protein KGJ06_01085, partial [Pseudomonadota bacterium]|nr:hypothetical protein [Pseudomonadota bacterium]